MTLFIDRYGVLRCFGVDLTESRRVIENLTQLGGLPNQFATVLIRHTTANTKTQAGYEVMKAKMEEFLALLDNMARRISVA